AITHCVVGVTHTEHTFLNQIHDLLVEGSLKSVSDMAGKFLVQVNRLLSDRRVERDCLLDCFWRCLRSTNNLDQGNNVRRIEWMPYQDALWMLALGLHHTGSNS